MIDVIFVVGLAAALFGALLWGIQDASRRTLADDRCGPDDEGQRRRLARAELDVLWFLQRDCEHIWGGADDCAVVVGRHTAAGGRGRDRGSDGDLRSSVEARGASDRGQAQHIYDCGRSFLGIADFAARDAAGATGSVRSGSMSGSM